MAQIYALSRTEVRNGNVVCNDKMIYAKEEACRSDIRIYF